MTKKVVDIDGHEAKGKVSILSNGNNFIEFNNLWIAPGAPDVYLAISYHQNFELQKNTIDIERIFYGQETYKFQLPKTIDVKTIKAIIIYCKQYSVLFGSGIVI